MPDDWMRWRSPGRSDEDAIKACLRKAFPLEQGGSFADLAALLDEAARKNRRKD